VLCSYSGEESSAGSREKGAEALLLDLINILAVRERSLFACFLEFQRKEKIVIIRGKRGGRAPPRSFMCSQKKRKGPTRYISVVSQEKNINKPSLRKEKRIVPMKICSYLRHLEGRKLARTCKEERKGDRYGKEPDAISAALERRKTGPRASFLRFGGKRQLERRERHGVTSSRITGTEDGAYSCIVQGTKASLGKISFFSARKGGWEKEEGSRDDQTSPRRGSP